MGRVAKVQEILRRWDPIGVQPGELAPADEYDSYAPHIVSMVAQGCSREQLGAHLETIRTEAIGVEAHQQKGPNEDTRPSDPFSNPVSARWP